MEAKPDEPIRVAAGNDGGTAGPRRPRRASAVRVVGEPVTLSRGELHAEVWSVPMLRLGPKYGLSDVGLAKICRKYDIPLPSRGYWARKQHGKPAKQTRLPDPDRNPAIEIRPYCSGTQIQDEQVRQRAMQAVEREREEEAAIRVPDRLTRPHPLIVQTQKAIREEEEKRQSRWSSGTWSDRLSIHVSERLLPRALRIADTLIKELERRGHNVEIRHWPHGGRYSTAVIFGATARFALREEGTGRLRLSIDQHTFGLRENWRDGRRQRVEGVLDDFIETLILVAAHEKDRAIQEEKKRQAREEERKGIQARIDAWHAEEHKVARLGADARHWDEAARIRSYVAAVRQAKSAAAGDPDPESETGRWLVWALNQADCIDPLKKSAPSILDQPCPEMPWHLRQS
jgi:hypothetical protein